MDKPLSILINEFKQKMIDSINQSGLHPILLEMIMRDIYNELKDLAQKQSQSESQQYAQAESVQPETVKEKNKD